MTLELKPCNYCGKYPDLVHKSDIVSSQIIHLIYLECCHAQYEEFHNGANLEDVITTWNKSNANTEENK